MLAALLSAAWVAHLAPGVAAAAPPHRCSCRVSGHALHEHATGLGTTVQLAWQLHHPKRNAAQRSFEVDIAATHGSDLRWRSGVIASAEQRLDTAELTATRLLLPPGASFRYSVRATVAAGEGTPTTLSCDGTFETAPDTTTFPGSAKWIGGGGQLHATQGLVLPPDATVEHARAYVSGVGAFYLFLNGQQVGENIMDPPQSVYSKRVLYETFDIASLLKPGKNSVDALLGNYKWGYRLQCSIWFSRSFCSSYLRFSPFVRETQMRLEQVHRHLVQYDARWGAQRLSRFYPAHYSNYVRWLGAQPRHQQPCGRLVCLRWARGLGSLLPRRDLHRAGEN